MSITETVPGIESLTLNITQEIHVKASLQTTFEALLEQIGPENESERGKMPMKIEAWPGHQAADTAGDHGSAVHVIWSCLERAISTERRTWGNRHSISSQGVWDDSGRASAGCE